MGEGAARRGSGGRHPRPCPGTRQVHPPRWTLGTYASSEVGREVGRALARRHRTVQNIWKKRLRISGTHIPEVHNSVWRTPVGQLPFATGWRTSSPGVLTRKEQRV